MTGSIRDIDLSLLQTWTRPKKLLLSLKIKIRKMLAIRPRNRADSFRLADFRRIMAELVGALNF